MDANQILLWVVVVASLSGVVRTAGLARAGQRGWLVVHAVNLVATAATYLVARAVAGYAGGTLWALLVLAPVLASRRLVRLVGHQQYGKARRLSRLLALLHPADGWPDQPRFFGALEVAQQGDFPRAIALLERLRSHGAVGRTATAHLFRLRGDFSGMKGWIEELTGGRPERDPPLLADYLWTLGESGDLNELVSTFARTLSSTEAPIWAVPRALGYLYTFAYCGRKEATARVLATLMGSFGPSVRASWLATAELAAGDVDMARGKLEELARGRDALVRASAERRLSRGVANAREVLSPESHTLLECLSTQLADEGRYGSRLAPSKTRTTATNALVVLNVLAFAAEELMGGSQDAMTLYGLGGLVPQAFSISETWRLLASTFLHWGPLHLFMNMVGLLAIGPYVERALGVRRFAAVYAAAGILSGLSVALLQDPANSVILVGASGCIMGLVGATGAVVLRGWQKERSRFALRRLRAVGFVFVLQVAFDLATPQVSFVAHFSGILIGFAAASFMRHWTPSPA
jgi:rhomboid protease GluP